MELSRQVWVPLCPPGGFGSLILVPTNSTDFERQVPFNLRCRQALQALPSIYPDPQAAIDNSPEISSKELHKTLQVSFSGIKLYEDRAHVGHRNFSCPSASPRRYYSYIVPTSFVLSSKPLPTLRSPFTRLHISRLLRGVM